ncbi:MAG TPA: hypothetical protein ENG98_02840 [Actinobacteria bacterium]|nr:putative zinc ribbon domain protein [bacterium BMS3Bbin02]HDL41936.1 hypothetical protein [Actinomycetota bacterium]
MEMKSYADLLDLQKVDSQIDRLLHDRENLPELASYKAAHGKVEELTAVEADATEKLKQTTRSLDRTQGELGLAETKLEREQLRLYSGGMSARDTDYLRREVEMLRTNKSKMEDELLRLMESSEEQEKSVQAVQAELAEVTIEKDRLASLIQAAWKALDGELARREARKADLLPTIDPDMVTLYEELRGRKNGVGVAALEDGVCGGCHLSLTATEELEAKRSDPPRCIHCRRILVV